MCATQVTTLMCGTCNELTQTIPATLLDPAPATATISNPHQKLSYEPTKPRQKTEMEEKSGEMDEKSGEMDGKRRVNQCSMPMPHTMPIVKKKYITLKSVEVKDCFVIKVKPSQGNVTGEKDAFIHKQDAVCRMCFKLLREVDDVLKAKCVCRRYDLLHTKCSQSSGIKCGSCEQIMQTVPVYLLDPLRPKPATISNPHQKKNHKPAFRGFEMSANPREKKKYEPVSQRNIEEAGWCSIS